MIDFFLAQLQEPVDRRICILLYLMLGLLVYFIADRSLARAESWLETYQDEMTDTLTTIELGTIYATQRPDVERELETLKTRQKQQEEALLTTQKKLVQCNEDLLLNLLRGTSLDSSPFDQYRARRSPRTGVLEEYYYDIQIQGGYDELVVLLQRLDASECAMNIKQWSLSRMPRNEEELSGTLQLNLYKEKRGS
jgi:hypothetical protein